MAIRITGAVGGNAEGAGPETPCRRYGKKCTVDAAAIGDEHRTEIVEPGIERRGLAIEISGGPNCHRT
jgi:hypothetical protein